MQNLGKRFSRLIEMNVFRGNCILRYAKNQFISI